MKSITLALSFIICLSGIVAYARIPNSQRKSKELSPTKPVKHYRLGEPAQNEHMKPEQTEYYSPVPKVVRPGKAFAAPPSDAIILFNGKNLNNWVSAQHTSQPAKWTVSHGVMTVKPGAGNIETKRKFEDYQLHIEWRVPKESAKYKGQNRGNSGIFLASLGPGDAGYELQVLDSDHSKTYVNGQAGSIYKQFPPLVNACRAPGQWQSYDVVWKAPRFNHDGALRSPATVTVLQNGVLIQDHDKLRGVTLYIGHPFYKKHGPSPIKLQDHHHKVSFRNIWVRKL